MILMNKNIYCMFGRRKQKDVMTIFWCKTIEYRKNKKNNIKENNLNNCYY